MDIYHTALIGTGYWGSIIFNTLCKITKKKIAVFDIDRKNSELLKKKFNNQVLIKKNIKEIFVNKQIKNLILATHPSVNFKLTKLALNYNKNIFIEKPIVTDPKKLKILLKLSKKKEKVLMGGYIYLYNPYIIKIKEILKNKLLGKIKYIEIERKNLGPIRNEVDAHVDLGSHDLSILKYLFKDKIKIKNIVKKEILKKNISDISMINLKIKNIICQISSSWLNPTKERKLLIIGSKKMLLFDEMLLKNKLKIFNKYAYYPKINKFNANYLSNKARIYLGETKNIKVNEKDALKNELLDFIKSSQNKLTPKSNGYFCLEILKLLN